MRLSFGMKVGLVSLFSCLALLLGLLSSTGLASAHTASTLQSAHISSAALADAGCPAGAASTVTFDKGEASNIACTDPPISCTADTVSVTFDKGEASKVFVCPGKH